MSKSGALPGNVQSEFSIARSVLANQAEDESWTLEKLRREKLRKESERQQFDIDISQLTAKIAELEMRIGAGGSQAGEEAQPKATAEGEETRKADEEAKEEETGKADEEATLKAVQEARLKAQAEEEEAKQAAAAEEAAQLKAPEVQAEEEETRQATAAEEAARLKAPEVALDMQSKLPPSLPVAQDKNVPRSATLSRYRSLSNDQGNLLKEARSKLSLSSVQWKLGNGQDCNYVCQKIKTKCDVNSLAKLRSQSAMDAAVTDAGGKCDRFEGMGVAGEWDGPWKSGGNCGYSNSPDWRPLCRNKPNGGFERICPCVSKAVDGGPFELIVASLKLPQDMFEQISGHGKKHAVASPSLLRSLGRDCIVYSLLQGGSMAYENTLLELGCTVHVFDCTAKGSLNLAGLAKHSDTLVSHSLCVGELTTPETPHVYTLDELQRTLGHTALDVLRIHLGKNTIEFIETFLAGTHGMTLGYQVSFVLREDDGHDKLRLGSLFRRLDRKGFRLVSKVKDGGETEFLMVATNWLRADSMVPAEARKEVAAVAKRLVAPPAQGEYKFQRYQIGQEASRHGQDKWVDSVLKKRKGLFVLESYTRNGDKPSDSLFLETARGWKCLLVQPEQSKYREILSTQRGCHLLEGDIPPVHNLAWALQRQTVDYWSVSTQGTELQVIGSADFKKIEFGVISIHHGWNIDKRDSLVDSMQKKGFTRVESLGEVDLYANPAYFFARDLDFPRAPSYLLPLDNFLSPLMRYFKAWERKHEAGQRTPGYAGPKLYRPSEDPRVRDCSVEVKPAPIPSIYHTVMIIERGAWINKTDRSQLIRRSSPEYQKTTPYEQMLISNIRHTVYIHEFQYARYLDDTACRQLLKRWSDELERIFMQEGDLRYKADICRVAALYYEGGYYFDDDMLSYRAVPPLIRKETDFASAIGVTKKDFFQSFMAVVPCHPVLKRNLEMLAEVKKPGFNWDREMRAKGYDILLGPATLKKSYDQVKKQGGIRHAQLLAELHGGMEKENWMHCGYVVKEVDSKETVFCSRF